jgi:hypothetical protein
MKGKIAAPLFDSTKEASRFETLCALAAPGNNNPSTARAIKMDTLMDDAARFNIFPVFVLGSF